MKNPVTSFNGWIMTKVVAYLSSKEGCVTEHASYSADGMRAIVRDTFGFRYEINIQTLSRVNDNRDGIDLYANTKKSSFDFDISVKS
jgi:hypothetical protein